MEGPAANARTLLEGMLRRVGAPLSATLQITDRCNYRCTHCYETHGRGEGELTLAEIERILDELAAAGTLLLSVTGGEPFVRDDCEAILAAAVARRFVTKLKTTGHFIDVPRAERIAALGLHEVQISVYAADPAVHDGVTRSKGSLARSLAAARALRARDVRVVFATPLMASNVGEMEAVRSLAEAMGAEHSWDPLLTAREDGEKGPLALRMTDEQVRRLYREERVQQKMLAEAHAQGEQGLSAPDLEQAPCSIGRTTCHVSPRGELYGCTALALPVGNLREASFADVWNGSLALQRLRSIRWADIPGCNACELRKYCQRCNAMALNEDGSLLGPSTEACRHALAWRESLRDRGMVPDSERALPRGLAVGFESPHARRPATLRVVNG